MFITKLGHYPLVLGLPWLRCHDINIQFATNTLTFDSDFCPTRVCTHATNIKVISIPIPMQIDLLPEAQPGQIAMIAGSTFTRALRRKKGIIGAFKTTTYEINQVLRQDEAITAEGKIKTLVPAEYHEFLPLSKTAVAEVLPPHR